MATNETIIELVKFTAAGTNDVVAAAKMLADESNKAAAAHAELAKAIADPGVRDNAVSLELVRRSTAALTAIETKRLDLTVRRQRLTSGAFATELRGTQLLGREKEKVERAERRAGLNAQYGRVGGAAAYYADTKAARFAGGAAVGIAGTAVAAAKGGFSGTVEGNRLALEFKLVSRELAGAFKPAIEIVTKALQNFRHWLEKLSPQRQNQLALVGGGVLTLAAAKVLGITGAIGTAAGWAGRAAFGTGAAGAASAAETAAARAGATRIPGLAATPPPAATGGAVPGVGTGGGFGSRALRFGGRILPVAAMGYEAYKTGKDVATEEKPLRALGRHGARALDALFELKGIPMPTGGMAAAFDARYGANKPSDKKADRNKVTIADAGFEGAGSAYERVTNALALTDAQIDTRDVLTQIRDMIQSALGLKEIPPPPPLSR